MSAEPQPRRGVALVIGVGEYAHDTIARLGHAVDDADALAELLADPDVCAFPRDRVRALVNRAATRDALVEALSVWLPKQCEGTELAVVYFAGHGAARKIGGKSEGYLFTHDTDPLNPAGRGVAMSELTKWVAGLTAESVVVCLDCCHAGLAMTFRDSEATRDVGITPEAVRGMSGKGRFLMAACDEGQKSAEVPALGHGLFTSHLLKGIAGDGDRDGDGKVGLSELFEYVANAVAADTRRLGVEQRPWTEVVAAGGEYISRPRARRADPLPPDPNAASIVGIGLADGPAAALAEIKRRMAGADEAALVYLLRQAGKLNDPLAVPVVVPYLAHGAEAVCGMAKRAVQAIGIDRTFAAVEELARRKSPDVGAVLDGLAAFEARADLVRMLDRIVNDLQGDLLVRAIALLDRKRLGLGLEDMRRLFRENRSQYELLRVLGKGQFTAAYLAHDAESDMAVVVRVLLEDFVPKPEVRKQFFDVCKRSIKIVHQNLVQTLQVRAFPDDKAYYTVRGHVDGVTLRDVLAGRSDSPGRRFSAAQVIEILRQLLNGLVAVHAAKACHGGVKPSNVFICSGDLVVLGDLAPVLPSAGTEARFAYNYRYTPPEVFRNEPVEPRADLYALGCVAYELFCGVPPFASDKPHDQLIGHLTGTIPPARTHEPTLPVEAEAFLTRLLARDSGARPTATEALAELDALHAAVARSVAPATRPAPPTPPGPPALPPLTAGAEPRWYFAVGGVTTGPVPFAELQAAAAVGRVSPADLVWQEGAAGWKSANAIEGLFAVPPLPPAADAVAWTIPPECTDSGASRPAERQPELRRVPIMDSRSLVGYRPAETRMSVGGNRPITLAPAVPPARADNWTTGAPPGPEAEGAAESAVEMPAFLGGFRIVRELGRGGMGTVYEAFDDRLGRSVAIKVMPPHIAARPENRARFLREARAAAGVDHENIVPILHVGDEAGVPFIVMPLLRGETLDARLRRDPSFKPEQFLQIAEQVATGLAAAHAHGLIHRDIKPSNIWLEAGGRGTRCRILDFGLARSASDEDQHVTASGAVMGTPAFMAPEQARGRPVDHRADLWSLGATMYYMATGHPPFRRGTVFETLMAITNDPLIPVREFAPHLPTELVRLIERLLEKDSAARQDSADEVAAVLQYIAATVRGDSGLWTPTALATPPGNFTTSVPPAVSVGGTVPPQLPVPAPAPTFWGRLVRWLFGRKP